MIKIKREHFEINGEWYDYELENGALLHRSEWNGEVYTVKDGKSERTYRPVQVHNKEQDTWTTVGFDA